MKTSPARPFDFLATSKYNDTALLLLRVFTGLMIMSHGVQKIQQFGTLKTQFADPIGLGSTLSLILIIFSEAGCSFLLILGLLTRLAAIPMAFGMGVAVFVVHAGQGFSVFELALLYMVVCIFFIIAGAGKFSLDYLFFGAKN